MSFFDNEAELYDKWYKTKMGNFIDEVETKCVFSLLKIKPGTKILDIGCGTGNFSIKLARMGCKVTAVDISEEMFRVLKDNGQLVIGTINKDSQWGDMYLAKEFQENTVFKYADFKTEKDLKQHKADKLKDIRKCLFISPSAKEEEISLSKEKELSKDDKRGGFLCALWEK